MNVLVTAGVTQVPNDKVRSTGKLVKFKLQVAAKSRIASEAALIVANCLEWARERAYILGADRCETVARANLPEALYSRVTS